MYLLQSNTIMVNKQAFTGGQHMMGGLSLLFNRFF